MKCECEKITCLSGLAAQLYARNHLEKVETDATIWQTVYVCPVTSVKWLMDYPHSEAHGGGEPQLRKMRDLDNIEPCFQDEK
ncbi:MAG: hypothetical protein DRI56_13250 [Chloroflexota bacterium]|nr:MAG: hypothetical protein DRI56_13250 [Chloroflexota bacterium]